ncbi:hypothetical protein HZH66_014692 [Vespula vulgaris]|uniref:Uncharacterized protein n=1 Tax=Vespula vulgaris TaxID=7454 RepID=A0A834J5D1_VESVU|nr:hypothetical protein HZH66_014692 [Vespula vulgaris]
MDIGEGKFLFQCVLARELESGKLGLLTGLCEINSPGKVIPSVAFEPSTSCNRNGQGSSGRKRPNVYNGSADEPCEINMPLFYKASYEWWYEEMEYMLLNVSKDKWL